MACNFLKGACLAGVAALTLSPAFAQDSNAPATDQLPPALPDPAPKTVKPFQPLAADGITLDLSYTGEAATNATGGLRRDAAYTGQIYMGANFDLDRIAGISGGTVHFAVTNRHGDSLSALALGNNTSVQEVWGTQNTHLAILTWEQTLLGGRLWVEAGRSQANIHFLNSPLYCNFQSNSTCGNPTFVFKNSNFTYFPASSWMAHAKVKLTSTITAHAGVYEVNPDRKRNEDNGFNFSTRSATGVIIPWELTYAREGAGTRLPGHYIVGGWFDRADYADPLRDDQDGIAILSNRQARTLHGRSGLYVRFDQMLTRPDPNSARGLSLFGVAMGNLSGRVEESHFLELGLLQTGTFRGRDRDTIGFMVNDQQFSDLAVARMRAAQISAGGDGNIKRHQYMMELAYGAQLSPAIRISPNVQYILNPDQSGAPFRAKAIPNALVFGFKFTVDAPTLLGELR